MSIGFLAFFELSVLLAFAQELMFRILKNDDFEEFEQFIRWHFYEREVPRNINYDRQVPHAFRML